MSLNIITILDEDGLEIQKSQLDELYGRRAHDRVDIEIEDEEIVVQAALDSSESEAYTEKLKDEKKVKPKDGEESVRAEKKVIKSENVNESKDEFENFQKNENESIAKDNGRTFTQKEEKDVFTLEAPAVKNKVTRKSRRLEKKDPIKQLSNLCVNNNWMKPEYTVLSGKVYSDNFLKYVVVLKVNGLNFTSIDAFKTRRLAKQAVASEFLKEHGKLANFIG
jgi:hypothetical protein